MSHGQDVKWFDGAFLNFGCLGFNRQGHTWNVAKNFCANLGAHLVEVYSEKQVMFLIQKAGEVGGGSFLTGGKFKHGAWYWDYSNKRVNSVITSKITNQSNDPNKHISFSSSGINGAWSLGSGPNWWTVCQY